MKKVIFILFATLAIASCDLLYNQDSDSFAPVNDISISAIETTPFVKQGEIVTVGIIVTNSGTNTVDEEFEISLNNQSEGITIGKKSLTSSLAPKDSVKVNYSWDTGNIATGAHILVAKHTFEDDNAANDSLKSTVTVSEPDIPDIAISEVRLPDTILEGDVIVVEVDVKNMGSQDVNETIAIALNDLTDGKTIGTHEIDGGLATGDSTTVTYSWDTQGYSIGEHELSASHNFDDENTANDTRTAHVTINDTPATDIAIAAIDAPSEATQGTDVEVSVTVENVGNLDTSEDVTVTLSDQTDGKQIASKSISGLETKSTSVLTFVWDTDEAGIGEHTLLASHNFDDENTANDSRSTNISISEAPVTDIAIAAIEAPSEATQGTDVELKVEIKNQGNQDIEETITITLVDQNDGTTIDSKSISEGLNAGAVKSVTFNWDTDGTSPGNYILAASLNIDDNTPTDTRSTEIRISEAPVTDIAVTAIEAPAEATQGNNVEFKVKIKNQGNQDVNNVVTIALVDQNDGTTIDSKSTSGGLDAGATETVTFNWNTESASPGNHILEASHNLDDDNSDNDSKSIEIEITEAVFMDVAITTINAPNDVDQNDKVTIEVTLENLGNRDFNEDIMVTLVDQTENKTIGLEKLKGGLKIGSSKTLKFKWDTKKAREGDHMLKASHNFTDDNLTNNARTFDIEVEDEDDGDDDDDDD